MRFADAHAAASVCTLTRYGVITICLNDLMATCAEIVGTQLPDNTGEDIVSILPERFGVAKGPVREATIHQAPSAPPAFD